jgi:methionyl-tRNA synthetase
MPERFYVTTPIYYVNARPHLGHAYTTIVADVARRFHAMCGHETYLLTGTDEHGDKIVQAAKAQNLSPKVYADTISERFRELWPQLNVACDQFIRTTDPAHMGVVEQILQRIYDRGDIYFSEYEGLYCFGCERFYTERELVEGKCPDHDTPPEIIRESNYFFRMSRYQDWLIQHIQDHPDFIRPERYRNEVLAFLREPLEDLCISRPKSRLQWGITLPFDAEYVTYVWFDALINYVSALGYPDGERFQRFWPSAQHIVAKDILKPHGIYWPTMLKAAGIPIYRHLNVHGYWNIEQAKMSKSIGNVVDPLAMKDVYGLDAFRFFLIREMAFGLDSNFSETALVQRINADLANDLGNLFSRVLTMTHKYCDGVVPARDPETEAGNGFSLRAEAMAAIEAYRPAMAGFAFHKGLQAVWEFIGRMNKFVDVTAPWVLAKKPSQRKQLEVVLYNLLEGLRVVAGLVHPVMPATSRIMRQHLGLGDGPHQPLELLAQWGSLPPGVRLPKSTTLFPRITAAEPPTEGTPAPGAAAAPPPVFKPEIGIDDCARLDLRVGTVLKAEAIPRARKLLKLEVDLGEVRTLVAGIAESYSPETIVGRQVVVVANLKPAKIMGVTSHGMILAAVSPEASAVLTPERPVAPGTRVA